MKYKVVFEIDFEADTVKEAALEVEDIMRNGDYRPYLEITDEQGYIIGIDLENNTGIKVESKEVVVAIDSGCAHLVKKPIGVIVTLKDYDVAEDWDEDDNHCKKDKDGDRYQVMVWDNSIVVA